MDDPMRRQSRRRSVPLMDPLGELCHSGRDDAAYLWQVPNDEAVRANLAEKLVKIRDESLRNNRREMARIVAELQTALGASPSPQQVEILQEGFDRLVKLWEAAKSGLM